MGGDGIMILIIFAVLIFVPLAVVFTILSINKFIRRKKIAAYTGVTRGTVSKIVKRGLDHPWVIYVHYHVNHVEYEIKETAKLKSSQVTVGIIPIFQRKTFVLGNVKEGDFITVHFDEKNPQKAIILGNEGVMTG